MSVSIKTISCPAGAFTLIANGKTRVSFKMQQVGSGRFFIGTALPAASTNDAVGINSNDAPEIGSLSAGDNIYFMPDGDRAIPVEVIGST